MADEGRITLEYAEVVVDMPPPETRFTLEYVEVVVGGNIILVEVTEGGAWHIID